MKKILLALLLMPFCAKAQLFTNPLMNIKTSFTSDTGRNNIIIADASGGYDVNSTTLTNAFFSHYAFDTYITDQIKANELPYLRTNNRAGGYGEAGIFLAFENRRNKNKTKKAWGSYYINVKDRQHFGINFTDDSYRLILYGNAMFAGKEAIFDNVSAEKAYYQTFQVGYYRTFFTGKEKLSNVIGGGVSLVKGSSFLDLNIKNGSLYTSNIGDSISISANGSASFTQRQSKLTTMAGWGPSVSIFYTKQITQTSWFTFSANDIGFISWKTDSAYAYKFNNAINFTGIDVNFVNGNLNTSSFTNITDSLANKVKGVKQQKSIYSMLPAQIQLTYALKLSEQLYAMAGFEYFAFSGHLPSVSAIGKYRLKNWIRVGLGVNALGYGNYGLIANLELHLLKNLQIHLGTQHLESYIAYDQTHAQGLFGRVVYRFNALN